jgi:NitT/TauT family transport system substrate-binding protein
MIRRLVLALLLSGPGIAAHAEASKVRVALQPGLAWLPFLVMGEEKLVETRAAAAGLGPVTAEYRTVTGGNVMNEALLAGDLDYATSGIPPFLILWDKGRGGAAVKAVSAFGATPFALVTRNPAVRTIRDFGPDDKIALPTVKASGQAVLLQIAVERAFGAASYARLDPLTISMPHPEAAQAIISGRGEITAHFSTSPFQEAELRAPGVHKVLTTSDIFATPFSNGLLYTMERFHDANPTLFRVFMEALQEAAERINADKREAAELYVRVTRDKTPVEEVLQSISAPGVEYGLAPHNVFEVASFMNRVGTLKRKPASWRDFFFRESHGLAGS